MQPGSKLPGQKRKQACALQTHQKNSPIAIHHPFMTQARPLDIEYAAPECYSSVTVLDSPAGRKRCKKGGVTVSKKHGREL